MVQCWIEAEDQLQSLHIQAINKFARIHMNYEENRHTDNTDYIKQSNHVYLEFPAGS